MRIDVLTLFPEVFEAYLAASIMGRARSANLVDVVVTQIREFATDVHRRVDDRPFGGGPGMVMMCGPLFDCVERTDRLAEVPARKILLTPQGRPLDQKWARELATEQRVMLVCGHYEGFDERIRIGLDFEELSIGDYVLSGGEPAAVVVLDAMVRLIPGALGCEDSAEEDSFSGGLLDFPQYTRPREFRGMQVPEVLLSGDHARIDAWRQEQALQRTRQRRPDLLEQRSDDLESNHEPTDHQLGQ
jgi:tRNA (guanine37-N1)-methyltransferase